MATETHIKTTQPSVPPLKVGDLWLDPSTGALKICVSLDPKVVFSTVAAVRSADAVANVAGTIPAGGVGAAAGGWDTSGNRDTAIATIGEIKTQLNALLAELRVSGVIA